MNPISNHNFADAYSHLQPPPAAKALTEDAPAAAEEQAELRDVFTEFVGQTFFQQMMSAMRKTVDKSEYFHGGRAEEVFQNQLDQTFAERMTEASAKEFADPMYELFMMKRQ